MGCACSPMWCVHVALCWCVHVGLCEAHVGCACVVYTLVVFKVPCLTVQKDDIKLWWGGSVTVQVDGSL